MTDQEQILMNILQCRRVDLFTGYSLTDDQKETLFEMNERRKNGEPLQYIIGNCDFMGVHLFVDKRVLIPRPETEILVDEIARLFRNVKTDEPLSILDLGTGSGNIAIALAKNIANCRVVSVDADADALKVARYNALYNHVEEKIHFFCGDMMDFLENTNERYDIVISNPPYIPTAQLASLPLDVKQEPRAALDGGEDGLRYYDGIIARAARVLKAQGLLAFELGDEQDIPVGKMLQGCFSDIRFIKDYVGINRIVLAKLSPSPGERGEGSGV